MSFGLPRAKGKGGKGREISPATIRNYIKAVRLICEMNDVAITWKKSPEACQEQDALQTTLDEIRRILEHPNRRIKPVIYTMSSAGISLEAWNYLRGGHIKPIEGDGKVVAAKITI
jgi:hypothetical protein